MRFDAQFPDRLREIFKRCPTTGTPEVGMDGANSESEGSLGAIHAVLTGIITGQEAES